MHAGVREPLAQLQEYKKTFVPANGIWVLKATKYEHEYSAKKFWPNTNI